MVRRRLRDGYTNKMVHFFPLEGETYSDFEDDRSQIEALFLSTKPASPHRFGTTNCTLLSAAVSS